jgi:hypothetical protein
MPIPKREDPDDDGDSEVSEETSAEESSEAGAGSEFKVSEGTLAAEASGDATCVSLLSEVSPIVVVDPELLDASAKTVATGERLMARIKIAETIFSLSLYCREKIFICMTPSDDASRLPWNHEFH